MTKLKSHYGLILVGLMHVFLAEHLLAQSQSNLAYTWITFAGQAGSDGIADGTGRSARFKYPYGLAIDSTNNLYVTDNQNHTIRKVSATGLVTTLAGHAGNSGSVDGTGNAALFNYPSGVAIDKAGNIFVADTWNHTIRRASAEGAVTTLLGSAEVSGSADGVGSAARFYYPSGVAVDNWERISIADTANHTIRMVSQQSLVTTREGSAGAVGSADGKGWTAQFNSPGGLAVDSAGIVYVADTGNHTIRKVNELGVVTTLAGCAGFSGDADGAGNTARFNYPTGVTVDRAGNLFVADTGNHTIRKVTPAGEVTTIGGQPGHSGTADGLGRAAQFNSPSGIAVDSDGNLYVADSANNRISKGMTGDQAPTIISIVCLASGHVQVCCAGAVGRSHTIQATSTLMPIVWINIGNAIADANGLFDFEDVNALNYNERYYRLQAP